MADTRNWSNAPAVSSRSRRCRSARSGLGRYPRSRHTPPHVRTDHHERRRRLPRQASLSQAAGAADVVVEELTLLERDGPSSDVEDVLGPFDRPPQAFGVGQAPLDSLHGERVQLVEPRRAAHQAANVPPLVTEASRKVRPHEAARTGNQTPRHQNRVPAKQLKKPPAPRAARKTKP